MPISRSRVRLRARRSLLPSPWSMKLIRRPKDVLSGVACTSSTGIPAKAASNLRKHRVSFEHAATVFRDPLMLSNPDEDHSEYEERWVTMGCTLATVGYWWCVTPTHIGTDGRRDLGEAHLGPACPRLASGINTSRENEAANTIFRQAERGKFFRKRRQDELARFRREAGLDRSRKDGSPNSSPREAKRTLASYRAATAPRLIDRCKLRTMSSVRPMADTPTDSSSNSSRTVRTPCSTTPNGQEHPDPTDGRLPLLCRRRRIPSMKTGVVGLMFSRMSSKRNTAAIGRFGLGFKSVLGVTDCARVLQPIRSSFRFDKACAAQRIARGRTGRALPGAASARAHRPSGSDEGSRTKRC